MGGTLMKNLALLVLMLIALAANNSWACSIQIDDTFLKNRLINLVANEFNISLDKVTKITLNDYSRQAGGTPPPGYSCEEYFESRARVTIAYKPNLLESCELSVTAIHHELLNAEDFPYEREFFELPTSSCVRRPLIIRPPVRPIPHG